MKSFITVLFCMILGFCLLIYPAQACAAEKSNWEFSFFGIKTTCLKERRLLPIIVGAATSLIVHESGHYLMAEKYGDGRWHSHYVTMYGDTNHSEQQMFHRAGFLAQLTVGAILTALPETRHADFTVGFNSFTFAHTLGYTITGGISGNGDIDQLDHGKIEGSFYTLGAGCLTYINLQDK